MIPATAAKLNLAKGARFTSHWRFRMEHEDGTITDFSALGGINWQEDVEWGKDLDNGVNPTTQLTIRLRRSVNGQSLAPLVTDSPLNQVASGYAPRVYMSRRFWLDTCIAAVGAVPAPADWIAGQVTGYTDVVRVDTEGFIVIEGRDQLALMDRLMETQRTYGTPTGVDLQAVIQNLWDDELGVDAPVLVTPVSPNFAVTEYKTEENATLGEATEKLSGYPGWYLEDRWDAASGTSKLTLVKPRTWAEVGVAQAVLGPSQYRKAEVVMDRTNIRNVVITKFQDAVTGLVTTRRAENTASIAALGGAPRGEQKIIFTIAAEEALDTDAEADAYNARVLSDLSEPPVDQEIEGWYFPWVELGDYYTWQAGPIYSEDQTWAVVGYRHRLSAADRTTVIRTRGQASAGFKRWHKRSQTQQAPKAVLWQYAEDAQGTGADFTFDAGVDFFARQSTDGGLTWTEWFRMVGESGSTTGGPFWDFRFKVSTTQPAAPDAFAINPAGWSDAPPAYDPSTGQKLWFSRAKKDEGNTTVLVAWDTPTQISGPQGQPGADGEDAITAALTNDQHGIPTDANGLNGNYAGADTALLIFLGTLDDTDNWAITATPTNVSGTLVGNHYTVTNITADVGYVDFQATRTGFPTQTARFTLNRVKPGAAGANGTSYKLITDVAAVKKTVDRTYVPNVLTVTAKKTTGSAAPVAYAGRFRIAESTDGVTYVDQYQSAADESLKNYFPTPDNGVDPAVKLIRIRLYLAGGTTTLLDEEIVPIVKDGPVGPKGDPGDPAFMPTPHIDLITGAPSGSQRVLLSASQGAAPYQWQTKQIRYGESDPGWPGTWNTSPLPTSVDVVINTSVYVAFYFRVKDANGTIGETHSTLMGPPRYSDVEGTISDSDIPSTIPRLSTVGGQQWSGDQTFLSTVDAQILKQNGSQVATQAWANGVFLPKTGGTLTGILTFNRPLSAGNQLMNLQQGYGIWSDNVGAGGVSRLWFDAPNLGEIVLGGRASNNVLTRLRVRATIVLLESDDVHINGGMFSVSDQGRYGLSSGGYAYLDLGGDTLLRGGTGPYSSIGTPLGVGIAEPVTIFDVRKLGAAIGDSQYVGLFYRSHNSDGYAVLHLNGSSNALSRGVQLVAYRHGSGNNHDFIIKTNLGGASPREVARFTDAGRLGIGISTPDVSTLLDVNGGARVRGNLTVDAQMFVDEIRDASGIDVAHIITGTAGVGPPAGTYPVGTLYIEYV